MKKCKYFGIKELASPVVCQRDGEKAWRYFTPVLIDFLDWVRENLGVVYVNNWAWGGPKTQRCLRDNLCSIVRDKSRDFILYLSAHVMGNGVDFNVKGMTPNEVRSWIIGNIHKFFERYPQYRPKIRLESEEIAKTWCHADFFDHDAPGIVAIIKPLS